VGGKPRLNKVKASVGYHRFLEEIYRAELDKIWAQIRQDAFDTINMKTGSAHELGKHEQNRFFF